MARARLARRTVGMIELRGSYRYASPAALEHALATARALLHDDDHDADWLRSFTKCGSTLAVHARLDVADPFAAAHVVQMLAEHAIEGVIDLQRGRAIDSFAPSDEL
jgi:hypothetical protein